MSILILYSEVRPAAIEGEPNVIQAEIEITNTGTTYGLTVGGIPGDTPNLQTYLEAHEAEYWRLASAAGQSSDLFDLADRRQNQVFKAFVLVVLQEVNTLRELHSLPAYTIAQLKQAIKNRLSDV